jgi:hypothetical protein
MAKETKTTVVEAEVTEVKKPRAKRTTRSLQCVQDVLLMRFRKRQRLNLLVVAPH